jgi:GDP-L-fucose synthase
MKVLILGHRGLVGSSLIRTIPVEHEVAQMPADENDLRDESLVLRQFKKIKPDCIILAAAKVGGIGANASDQKGFLLENLRIQNSVLLAASTLRIQNLIFLGSSCIYPRLASQPISESSLMTGELEPTNEGYAIAKIAGIRLVSAIYEQENLKYFSLMPTNMYGPHDNYNLQSSHVPAALIRRFHEAKIHKKDVVKVWGTGKPRREFMHVDDLANACWYFLEKEVGGELINIGTGIDVEILQFAKLVAEVVGYQGRIEYDALNPDGTPRKLLDVSKAHSFGWKHQIELVDGLEQTYDWFVNALSKGEVRGY